ncbi:uncharacterized protein [Antedon mediterranea]|uniref:uncharacterized protein n=1 Tax=Antedon mediterranea TaxID=105859 RepID=UPI003AF5C175
MRQDAAIQIGSNLPDFEKTILQAASKRSSCTQKISSVNEELDELRNTLSLSLVKHNDANEISEITNKIYLKEQSVKDLQSTIYEEIKYATGSLCTEMDNILTANKIPRQQYHRKSFVGNHVYRACKFNIIDKLMDGLEIVLKQQMHHCKDKHTTILATKLSKIRQSFTPPFKLFSQVHACINHTRFIDDPEIDAYEHAIKSFSVEYRKISPGVWYSRNSPCWSITLYHLCVDGRWASAYLQNKVEN